MSANAKPTPGPWRWKPRVVRDGPKDLYATVQAERGRWVAECGSHEDSDANAALIAAAPDMAAVLLEMVDGNTTPETRDRARAALQKAGLR